MVPNLEVVLPPSLGHQQDVVMSGVARPTNCVEAWHFGHQASFIGAPPFIKGKWIAHRKTLPYKNKIFRRMEWPRVHEE